MLNFMIPTQEHYEEFHQCVFDRKQMFHLGFWAWYYALNSEISIFQPLNKVSEKNEKKTFRTIYFIC